MMNANDDGPALDSGIDADEREVALRTWAVLTEASVAASIAVLPYLLELQKDALAAANAKREAAGKRPISPPRLAMLTAAQGQITFGVTAALGLRAGRRMGLGAPRLEALLRGRPSGLPPSRGAGYAAAGAGSALLIGLLDRTLFAEAQRRFKAAGMRQPSAWRGLLASTYGAIGEEVLMRLGLQTLLAAGLRRLNGETTTPPSGATMWPAIVVSNLAFGAGHLPATKAIVPLTPLVVARALLLNAVAGTLCGYLYWREGLEAAMIAHGSADLVLHVGGALLQGRQGDNG